MLEPRPSASFLGKIARILFFVVSSVGGLLLIACQGKKPPSADEVARQAILGLPKPILMEGYEGISPEIIANCAIATASREEISAISQAALLGSSTDSLYLILPVLGRPETDGCIRTGAVYTRERRE